MSDRIEHLIGEIKAARARQGLSQRGLGAKVGVPQSHISKIEKGAVDLQTSSLIELARALGLELMLVPRALVPAVKGLQRNVPSTAPLPAYRLDEEEDLDEQDGHDA